MPRRFTISSKTHFARYMISHDHIQAFTLDMAEYEELCCLLNLKPRAVRNQKFVNVVNLNLLLGQFRLNRDEWLRLLEGTERKSDESDGESNKIIDSVEEEKCKCEHCIRSAAWNGIRRYKFSDYKYCQLPFTVEISPEKWREYRTCDKKENLKLRPGFAGLITAKLRQNGWQCIPAVKDNYYVVSNDCLRITVYCVWGDVDPCNLLILEYYPNLPECNPQNQSKVFIVKATDMPLRHCEYSYRVPHIKGYARNVALIDASKMTPKTHDEYLVTHYGEINSQAVMDKWPASRQTIKNIRSEYLNRFQLANDNVTDLAALWNIERQMPDNLDEPSDEFRYVQHVAVGPLQIVLMSNDQIKILKNERLKYDQSELPKRPRFSLQLDATGSIIAPIKNCDEKKRRYNYALVLPIHIPKDTSKHDIIFSVADYIANVHTAKSINFFLSEIFERQPGIQAIVTDFCWAQINAIVKLNHGINVEAYLKMTYKYVTTNDENLQKYMDSSYVFCFLCLTHLSKNVLRDLSAAVKDKKVLSVLQCLFVEMAHCEEYTRLLSLFRAMCVVSMTNNRITNEFVRFVSDDKLNQLLEDVDMLEDTENIEDELNSGPLYEISPFFQDFNKIFEEIKETYDPDESTCIVTFLQKYMAYVPMWTSVCHKPKSESEKKTIPFFRFNTNIIERYWGDTKEKLRAQVLEYGKTPLPATRFIRFKKTQTRADIIRYRNNIPISRMSCRPGTYKRKNQTTIDVYFQEHWQTINEISNKKTVTPDRNITTDQLETVQAKWSRRAKVDNQTTPKGLAHKPIQKKLFDKRITTVALKGATISEYFKMIRNLDTRQYKHPYYVARFENHVLDVKDMLSLADGKQIYDSCLDCLLSLANKDKKVNMMDTYSAAKLFQMGLFGQLDLLDAATHHRIGGLIANLLTEQRETLIPVCFSNHFYLVKINVKEHDNCRIEVFDSLRNNTNLTAADFYNRFTRQVEIVTTKTGMILKLPPKSKWVVKDIKCAQQADTYNCGIYVLRFAEKVIKGEKKFTQKFNADDKRKSTFQMLQKEVEQQIVCFNCCRLLETEAVAAKCLKCSAAVDIDCLLNGRCGETVNVNGAQCINCPACEP